MLNGYLAFYKGQTKEVYATSSFQAQEQAAKAWRVKGWKVRVMIAEKDGKPVYHSTASL